MDHLTTRGAALKHGFGRALPRALFFLLLAAAWPAYAQGPERPQRTVAFTFDDLPVVRFTTTEDVQAIHARLRAGLRELKIPAIGFVNEIKLEAARGPANPLVALLEAWLDAGLDLGNHTYSHMRLFDVPLARYQADVLRGEQVTGRLLAARGRHLRYFRHPMLNTGPDLKTKQAFEQFLRAHGYVVAPVTLDSEEFLYALAYDRARGRRDTALMERLGNDYIRHMGDTFSFYEHLSMPVLGREPSQILLLHANALNGDYLGRLARMISGRGYRFVSLQRALEDPAYAIPDNYIGSHGPSWLVRWATIRGSPPAEPPAAPPWVVDIRP